MKKPLSLLKIRRSSKSQRTFVKEKISKEIDSLPRSVRSYVFNMFNKKMGRASENPITHIFLSENVELKKINLTNALLNNGSYLEELCAFLLLEKITPHFKLNKLRKLCDDEFRLSFLSGKYQIPLSCPEVFYCDKSDSIDFELLKTKTKHFLHKHSKKEMQRFLSSVYKEQEKLKQCLEEYDGYLVSQISDLKPPSLDKETESVLKELDSLSSPLSEQPLLIDDKEWKRAKQTIPLLKKYYPLFFTKMNYFVSGTLLKSPFPVFYYLLLEKEFIAAHNLINGCKAQKNYIFFKTLSFSFEEAPFKTLRNNLMVFDILRGVKLPRNKATSQKRNALVKICEILSEYLMKELNSNENIGYQHLLLKQIQQNKILVEKDICDLKNYPALIINETDFHFLHFLNAVYGNAMDIQKLKDIEIFFSRRIVSYSLNATYIDFIFKEKTIADIELGVGQTIKALPSKFFNVSCCLLAYRIKQRRQKTLSGKILFETITNFERWKIEGGSKYKKAPPKFYKEAFDFLSEDFSFEEKNAFKFHLLRYLLHLFKLKGIDKSLCRGKIQDFFQKEID